MNFQFYLDQKLFYSVCCFDLRREIQIQQQTFDKSKIERSKKVVKSLKKSEDLKENSSDCRLSKKCGKIRQNTKGQFQIVVKTPKSFVKTLRSISNSNKN